MNLTKEEIEEIKEALETYESFLNGTDIQATETIDTESTRKRIEMIHSIKNKLDNAHVIYLWRE
jgi:hypothetical protein